jgi:hypothetical protein
MPWTLSHRPKGQTSAPLEWSVTVMRASRKALSASYAMKAMRLSVSRRAASRRAGRRSARRTKVSPHGGGAVILFESATCGAVVTSIPQGWRSTSADERRGRRSELVEECEEMLRCAACWAGSHLSLACGEGSEGPRRAEGVQALRVNRRIISREHSNVIDEEESR